MSSSDPGQRSNSDDEAASVVELAFVSSESESARQYSFLSSCTSATTQTCSRS